MNPVQGTESAGTRVHHGYGVVVALMLVYAFNVVDRNIIVILLEPIKHEMRLSDTQLGFLTGVVFAFFYSVMGIPMAMWADRHNRRNLIILTLVLFAGMTLWSGLAAGFLTLLCARMLMAVAQAGTSPAAHSMISDMFPPHRRAAALSTYLAGMNVGQLLLFLVGGWVSQVYGWRAAYLAAGIPALLLALVVGVVLKEPPRGQSEGLQAQAAGSTPPLGLVIAHLWAQRSFRHLIAAIAIGAIGSFSIVIWFPSFLRRSVGMSALEVGTAMALYTGILGGTGTYLSGHIADRLGRRDVRWNLWLAALTNALVFPFCVAAYLAGSRLGTLALFVFPSLAFTANLAPSIAMTHGLATVRMRAQASALLFFTLTIVGQSVGPQLTGLISDHLARHYGRDSLRYALLIMSVFWLWSAVHFLLATRTLKDDLARVRQAAAMAAA